MGDCKNSRVVFLLFVRSQSWSMQIGVNLQYRSLLEKKVSKVSFMEGEEQQNTLLMTKECQKLGCI